MFKNLKKQIEYGSNSGNATDPSASVPKSASTSGIQSLLSTTDYKEQQFCSEVQKSLKRAAKQPNTIILPTQSGKDGTVAGKPKDKESQGLEVKMIVDRPPNEAALDVAKLRARNDSLEQAYDSYKTKTMELLTKKDNHISRLQDRVATLEAKLAEKPVDCSAERDQLKAQLQNLQTTYDLEITRLKQFNADTLGEWEKKVQEMSNDQDAKLMEAASVNFQKENAAKEAVEKLNDENKLLHARIAKLMTENEVISQQLRNTDTQLRLASARNVDQKVELEKHFTAIRNLTHDQVTFPILVFNTIF